jgi:thiamine-phosphate pyrophosphorylase
MVQFRDKSGDFLEIKSKALAIKSRLSKHNIPLIINDFVDLAIEIDADGIHLGNNDMSVSLARKKLGNNKIIGMSIESFSDLDKANFSPANYVTASAVFPSATKTDCKMFWGINGLQEIVSRSVHPVTAIGGITSETIVQIFNTGAKGVAVVSAISNAKDPKLAAMRLLL